MHLNLYNAVAGAVFAAASPDIETEAPGLIAAQLSFRKAGKQFTDRREQAGISSRIGAGGAANGRLVNNDGFVELLDTRSEEHTSELQSLTHLVRRLLLE